MELSEVESRLNFAFPAKHLQSLLNLDDPIHTACDFLTLSAGKHGNLVGENEWLHSNDFGDPWPDYLIAFASNGCGDYFAYDTRQRPVSIIYIDPDNTVAENLEATDKLRYDTFEAWYESTVSPRNRLKSNIDAS